MGKSGSGLTLLIRKDIKCSTMSITQYPNSQIEALGVRIACLQGWATFILCYSQIQNAHKQEFEHIFRLADRNCIIFGDFNARHTFWNPLLNRSDVNASRRALYETISDYDLALLTPGRYADQD